MKAWQYLGPKKIELVEVPDPQIKDDEVLLKIKKVGICGTDLHIYHGGMDVPVPITPGHEFTGEIAEVGASVTNLKKGTRVVAEHVVGCGKCQYCQEGRKNICDEMVVYGLHRPGALAEYMAIPASLVYPVPDKLTDDEAVLVEPLSIAVYGVRRGGVKVGDVVTVTGQGPIGLFLDQVASAAGALVFGVDINPARLEYAKKHRLADGVINSKETDVVKALAELAQTDGSDVSFEAVGQEVTAATALQLVRPEGRMVVLGVFEHDININMMKVVKKEITVVGSWTCLNVFPATINMLESGTVKTEGFITHRYPFSEVDKAFAEADSYSDNRIKSIIEL